MSSTRGLLAMLLVVSLEVQPLTGAPPTNLPMGILTRAYLARLNSTPAFAGLSVFDGEAMVTESDGKLGVRVGSATIACGGDTEATLHQIERGAHVDLTAGTVFFTAPENARVEVHAEESLLRPEHNQLTQAEVRILSPKVLEVSARRGDLAFSYHEEFQLIPEGATYRIYLDAPAEPQGPEGAGASDPKTEKAARLRKVAYFVVAGAAVGLTVWGARELYESQSGPESPAKP